MANLDKIIEQAKEAKAKLDKDIKEALKNYEEFAHEYIENHADLKKKIDDEFEVIERIKREKTDEIDKEIRERVNRPGVGKLEEQQIKEELNGKLRRELEEANAYFARFYWDAFHDAVNRDKGKEGRKFRELKKKYEEAQKAKQEFLDKLRELLN